MRHPKRPIVNPTGWRIEWEAKRRPRLSQGTGYSSDKKPPRRPAVARADDSAGSSPWATRGQACPWRADGTRAKRNTYSARDGADSQAADRRRPAPSTWSDTAAQGQRRVAAPARRPLASTTPGPRLKTTRGWSPARGSPNAARARKCAAWSAGCRAWKSRAKIWPAVCGVLRDSARRVRMEMPQWVLNLCLQRGVYALVLLSEVVETSWALGDDLNVPAALPRAGLHGVWLPPGHIKCRNDNPERWMGHGRSL